MEARGDSPLTCQNKTSSETVDLDGLELAQLPVTSMDSRDMLGEIVYAGKAVMKALYFGET